MDPSLIGFVHIPKTGGTSLRRAFRAAGRTVWRPRGPRYPTTFDVPDLTGVEVVAGHIPFAVFRSLPVGVWVTVLRDPVDRWVSHYMAEAGPEGDWPDPSVVPDNLACRMLTDFTPDDEQAWWNLAAFDHVGFFDRLDVTFGRYGLAPLSERPSPFRRPPPPWVADAAREANRHDLALYRKARECS